MKPIIRFFICFCLSALANIALANITLPQPQQTGGEGIFKTLKERRSVTSQEFPLQTITQQELSNLLWAATGPNRESKGWTIPLAHGQAPYNTIFVLNKDGVYQYDWKNNQLLFIQSNDLRAQIGKQPFVKTAPIILVFVSNKQTPSSHAYIASGAMSQNIYLAAASMQLKTRFIMYIDEAGIKNALKLNDNQYATHIMVVGKKQP